MAEGVSGRGPHQNSDPAGVITLWAAHPDRAVIFDFNGTLSDDEPLILRIYTEMFLEHLKWTLTPSHYYATLAGRSDREIINSVVAELDPGNEALATQLLMQRRHRYCELVEKRSPIAPETAAFVHLLYDQGLPLGIVTGAQRIDVEFVISRSAVSEMFSVIIAEEDVARGKPDPEGFLAGAQKLGVEPAHILAFEDSVPGVRAAKAAGMRCIAVEGTRERSVLEREADAVARSLDPRLMP